MVDALNAAGNAHIKKVSLKILDAGKKSAAKEGDPILTESAEDNNAPGCTVMLDTAQYSSKPSTVGVRIHTEAMKPPRSGRSAPDKAGAFSDFSSKIGENARE